MALVRGMERDGSGHGGAGMVARGRRGADAAGADGGAGAMARAWARQREAVRPRTRSALWLRYGGSYGGAGLGKHGRGRDRH